MTRLLGQSPAALSATGGARQGPRPAELGGVASGGDSDTRNTYDRISARQEADLRPKLERLDRLFARSEGIDPGALTFAFRPLWQLDAATAATVALQKAQATQIYAGLELWPAAVTARLVEAQLAEDGTYPNAAATFAEASDASSATATLDFDPDQPRDPDGRWTAGGGGPMAPASGATSTTAHPAEAVSSGSGGILGFLNALNPIGMAQAQEIDPEEESRRVAGEPTEPEPGDALLLQRFNAAWQSLREIDPTDRNLESLEPPGYVPTDADIARVEMAAREAYIARTCDFLQPNGRPIGEEGTRPNIREMPGGLPAALRDFDYLRVGGTEIPFAKGSIVRLPYGAATITFRPVTSTPASPAIGISVPGFTHYKLHY